MFNTEALLLQAALDGFGITYLFEDGVRAHLEAGTLVRVLEDWCEPFPGYLPEPQRSGTGAGRAGRGAALPRMKSLPGRLRSRGGKRALPSKAVPVLKRRHGFIGSP